LAIVFILGVLPFAVAFITSAGSSSDEAFEASIFQEQTTIIQPPYSYWLDNGGDNYSNYYITEDPTNLGANRTYVKDGLCPARNTTSTAPCFTFGGATNLAGATPMPSLNVPMSHYYSSTTTYVGSSGDGPFSWYLQPRFFSGVEQGTAIDKFRMTFVDQNVDINCGSTIFTNITYEGSIEFVYGNSSKRFSGFEFASSNKLEYESRDLVHGFQDVCHIGFQTEFDLTGFESLTLDDFNGGDWDNTSMILTLENFQRKDRQNFGSTSLPFAWSQRFFALGIEHQPINEVQAGFIIRGGTLVLAVATFALAVASTPYWDPFRNTFKGMIQ
jgi:hypothetical protein